jgi:hypothetical protein
MDEALAVGDVLFQSTCPSPSVRYRM